MTPRNRDVVPAQPSGTYTHQHPPCCSQVVLQLNQAYQNVCGLLQSANTSLNHQKNQISQFQQELLRERDAHEQDNQQSQEFQDSYAKLKDDYENLIVLNENLNESLKDSAALTEEAAKRAEGVIKNLEARLKGGEVSNAPNGQTVSGLILDSAKNAVLVSAMSSKFSDEDCVTRLKGVMDANVEFQQQIHNLTEENRRLNKLVEDRDHEIINLTTALTSQGGRRHKARRGKGERAK